VRESQATVMISLSICRVSLVAIGL
jgi:hypothetical protein